MGGRGMGGGMGGGGMMLGGGLLGGKSALSFVLNAEGREY